MTTKNNEMKVQGYFEGSPPTEQEFLEAIVAAGCWTCKAPVKIVTAHKVRCTKCGAEAEWTTPTRPRKDKQKV